MSRECRIWRRDMRRISRLAVAALLVVSTATAASAQVKGRSGAAAKAPRVQSAPNLVSDPYGERPRSPGLAPCSERPFALGCDKRGFW
jgi:hypothetical protein